MRTYSIKEIASRFDLSIPTIRYYDQEGLIPDLQRDKNGNRIFNEHNLYTIQSIKCLKKTGMPIKNIKKYVKLTEQGDQTLEQRLDFFQERKRVVLAKMNDLQKILDEIDWKCEYYQEAIKDGTEKYVQQKIEHS